MKIFAKIKSDNSKLDKILEKKVFSSNAKNLILSMMYKLEISYPDFKDVKRVVEPKEQFLNNLINCVDEFCDNVKLVEPETEKADILKKNNVIALTNLEEKSILCYPTEASLLYAMSEILPKYFYISNGFVFKNSLQTALVNGYSINNKEILSNFNGWSWEVNMQIDYVDNLIYQNLLFLLGYEFLNDWRESSSSKRNFLKELKEILVIFNSYEEFFFSLCSVLYKKLTENEKKQIDVVLKAKIVELERMKNKEEYLEECRKLKLKYSTSIKKIDLLLSSDYKMCDELEKMNYKLPDSKKIKSLKLYKKLLKNEKEKYLIELNDISNMLKPRAFVEKKMELEFYERIYNNADSLNEALVKFEKNFLKLFDEKIESYETRDELINNIYKIRYIKNIPISKSKFVGDISSFSSIFTKMQKKTVTKACKLGAMKILSMDIDLNYKIISYVLDTKMIDLEEIKLVFDYQKPDIIVQVFDKDVFEKSSKINIENFEADLLEIKYGKKINLFGRL